MTALLVSIVVLTHGQQTVVDKTVATVSDGARTELITYSDLRWQLALQPGIPLNPPSSDDLNRALRTLIDQRLFALEAERLPRDAPSKAEITETINETVKHFASSAEFENRLRMVGFKSVSDLRFEEIISERIAIEKYLTFRFRSFIVITAADEEQFYREVFIPEFRRRNSGRIIPSLQSSRADIVKALTERRVAEQMDAFLEDAKRRAQIVILNPV